MLTDLRSTLFSLCCQIHSIGARGVDYSPPLGAERLPISNASTSRRSRCSNADLLLAILHFGYRIGDYSALDTVWLLVASPTAAVLFPFAIRPALRFAVAQTTSLRLVLLAPFRYCIRFNGLL